MNEENNEDVMENPPAEKPKSKKQIDKKTQEAIESLKIYMAEEHISPSSIQEMMERNERKSYYGKRFKGTLATHWYDCQPLGWVHLSEYPKFKEAHAKCAHSEEWTKRSEMVHRDDGLWIKESVAKQYYDLDPDWGRYYLKGSGKQVYSSTYEPVTVSPENFEANYSQCSIDGFFYHDSVMHPICQPSKYKKVCAKNLSNDFQQCDNCSGYTEEIKLVMWDDGDSYCPTCYKKKLGESCIRPHNHKGYPAPIHTPVTRYGHTFRDGFIWATNKIEEVKNPRLFGVELETEMDVNVCKKLKITRVELAHHVRNTLGKDFVMIKEDGTLTFNAKYSDTGNPLHHYAGFEIVSAPADKKAHEERWKLLEKVKGYEAMRAWDTETCGFHVHVSRAALTNLQIGRMLVFINHPENKRLVAKIAGRSEKKFTKYVPKEFNDVLHPERVINPDETNEHNRSRRVALNLCNANTVEFRIFRGTVHPRHIMRNLEFCDAVCDFCYPASRSLIEYKHPSFFIAYIDQNKKKWPLLAEWMVRHEMIVLKPAGEKANRQLLTLKPMEVVEHEDKTDEAKQPELGFNAVPPQPAVNAVTFNVSAEGSINVPPPSWEEITNPWVELPAGTYKIATKQKKKSAPNEDEA